MAKIDPQSGASYTDCEFKVHLLHVNAVGIFTEDAFDYFPSKKERIEYKSDLKANKVGELCSAGGLFGRSLAAKFRPVLGGGREGHLP